MNETKPPSPPEGYEFYTGPYDWSNLPTGSKMWIDGEWKVTPFVLTAIDKGIYAVPKLKLPDMPKASAPRLTILEEAQDLVCGDRQQAYGDAYESFDRIAKLWSAYKGIRITPKDVASMMILMKVSRSVTSSKRDNWVDMAGYAELGSQIEGREAAPE